MIKTKNLCINLNLKYWDKNKLNGWAMFQKLSFGGFSWTEETSKFNKNFIKGYNEGNDIGNFLKVDVENPKKYTQHSQRFAHFVWKKEDWKSWKTKLHNKKRIGCTH